MQQKVRAFAPATIANLGVGFDILGMAVENLGDYVTVEKQDTPDITITGITGDNRKLSLDPKQNTAAIAAQSVLNIIHATQGIKLYLEKGLPLSSGLGGSAASAVAAAVATNALFGEPLTKEE